MNDEVQDIAFYTNYISNQVNTTLRILESNSNIASVSCAIGDIKKEEDGRPSVVPGHGLILADLFEEIHDKKCLSHIYPKTSTILIVEISLTLRSELTLFIASILSSLLLEASISAPVKSAVVSKEQQLSNLSKRLAKISLGLSNTGLSKMFPRLSAISDKASSLVSDISETLSDPDIGSILHNALSESSIDTSEITSRLSIIHSKLTSSSDSEESLIISALSTRIASMVVSDAGIERWIEANIGDGISSSIGFQLLSKNPGVPIPSLLKIIATFTSLISSNTRIELSSVLNETLTSNFLEKNITHF